MVRFGFTLQFRYRNNSRVGKSSILSKSKVIYYFESFVASSDYINFKRTIYFIAYLIIILKLKFSEKPKKEADFFQILWTSQNIITLTIGF